MPDARYRTDRTDAEPGRRFASGRALNVLVHVAGWWAALTALLAGTAVCPICGQSGCPGGAGMAGLLGAVGAVALERMRAVLGHSKLRNDEQEGPVPHDRDASKRLARNRLKGHSPCEHQ